MTWITSIQKAKLTFKSSMFSFHFSMLSPRNRNGENAVDVLWLGLAVGDRSETGCR